MNMEVDLLRPGTVPISTDTVLWFEFLLDPDLLIKHLQKPNADPSATELVTKFYDVIAETLRNNPDLDNNDAINVDPPAEIKIRHPTKNIALKILSLKVMAYLKWNLTGLRALPFKTQVNLLQDLLSFVNDNKPVEIPNVPIVDKAEGLNKEYLFGLVVFHRWLLYTTMHRITSDWHLRFTINDVPYQHESVICTADNVQRSVQFLIDCLSWQTIPDLLTVACFKTPTESNDSIEFDWAQSEPISKAEYYAQINYDLGVFFFYKEDYKSAKLHFQQCEEYFKDLKSTSGFCNIDNDSLYVYIHACQSPNECKKENLLEQLYACIFNEYDGVLNILQEDNVKKEIPLTHRINLELDVQGGISSGTFTAAKDILSKIKAFNIIRCVLDRKPVYQAENVVKQIDSIIWAIETSWKSFNDDDKQILKTYLFELFLKNEIPDLLIKIQKCDPLKNIFDKNELQYIKRTEIAIDLPQSLSKTDLNLFDFIGKKRKPQLELRQLEQQLIASYDHLEIRELVMRITKTNVSPNYSIWKVNSQWELPIPLQSVLKNFPKGFLNDFAYVMLAKSREQMLNKNWISSLELLIILDKELQASNGNVSKLFKLVSWELLLVQITQFLAEWPKNSIDKNALADACEACLQCNESILPRSDITEQCIICLLNLKRWEFLVNCDKRWASFELSSAIALACQELVTNKPGKKLSKNLWDLVIPIFVTTSSQSKRGGPASSSYHEVTNMKMNVMSVFSKLRDSMTLTVVISLLTKLFNILKDEASLELQVEYSNLWPAVISNANSYNSVAVSELLSEMVLQALKYNPTNVPWLRLMADINYANGHYRNALNYYLKSLLIYNEYFNVPVRNDDHVFRRMIKCCTALGCNTQAAVLCQFLEEPDYLTAFRILGDQKTCNDAVDAYYHCFWDTNILEFLTYNHNKRGEFQRRKCAIQVVGLLELNSSNNEEIQREASNLRKSTFLRALCKQFVF